MLTCLSFASAVVFGLFVVGTAGASGCSSSDSSNASLTDAAPDVEEPGLIVVDAGNRARDGGDAAADAGAALLFDGRAPANECEAEAAMASLCGDDLQCGNTRFAGWCSLLGTRVNSAQRNAAVLRCATPSLCDTDDRSACVYASYNTMALSATQRTMVEHFCASCYPGDEARCFEASTKYTTPSAVTDVFLAAWELGETLTKSIDDECIPKSVDGGADAVADGSADASEAGDASDASDASDGGGPAACARRFGQCAGGLYVDSLPDCP